MLTKYVDWRQCRHIKRAQQQDRQRQGRGLLKPGEPQATGPACNDRVSGEIREPQCSECQSGQEKESFDVVILTEVFGLVRHGLQRPRFWIPSENGVIQQHETSRPHANDPAWRAGRGWIAMFDPDCTSWNTGPSGQSDNAQLER